MGPYAKAPVRQYRFGPYCDPALSQFGEIRQVFHHLLAGGIHGSEVVAAHLRVYCFIAEMFFQCDHSHSRLTRWQPDSDVEIIYRWPATRLSRAAGSARVQRQRDRVPECRER